MDHAEQKTDVARFDTEIRARCPASLIAALDKAAAKSMMSQSEYVRRCVFDRIVADGFDPVGEVVKDVEPADIRKMILALAGRIDRIEAKRQLTGPDAGPLKIVVKG